MEDNKYTASPDFDELNKKIQEASISLMAKIHGYEEELILMYTSEDALKRLIELCNDELERRSKS